MNVTKQTSNPNEPLKEIAPPVSATTKREAQTEVLLKEIKVSSNFRDQQTQDQPCLSVLSPILSFMSGCNNKITSSELKTDVDNLHVPRALDIRLEAANLLTAIMEHDQYLDFKDRCYIQIAIDTLDLARAREENAMSCGGA